MAGWFAQIISNRFGCRQVFKFSHEIIWHIKTDAPDVPRCGTSQEESRRRFVRISLVDAQQPAALIMNIEYFSLYPQEFGITVVH